MLPKSSREWRRHAVKRIIVEHVEVSRRTGKRSLERVNPKLCENLSTNKNAGSIGRKFLTTYLRESSVHGIKYLSNLRIRPSIVGKVFWALIMICSFMFLIWMVNTFWTRYSADPLRSVVETFEAPIFMIPFPAITLCPLIPPLAARRKKLLARLKLPDNINSTMAMFLLKYGAAFSSERVPGGKDYMEKLKMLLEYNDITLLELVKLLRPCEDLIESCWWDGVKVNCSELFKVSRASQGICCSFNYQLENYIGHKNYRLPIDYRRTTYFGPPSGLTVILHRSLLIENDGTGEYIKYSTNSVGILVYAHHPLEYLGPVAKRHLLQAQQELRVAVIPYIRKKLGGYTRRDGNGKRIPHCVEGNAATLKYLPVYLYSNCFTECSIRASLQICGCVPFYYETVAIEYSLKICDWEEFDCLYKNADNIRRMVQKDPLLNITCKCFSPCMDVFYDTQVSLGILNRHESNIRDMHKNLSDTQAILKVFMNYETFTMTETIPIADELYLLASVGGIFSLFVGCSFISAVEIFYFVGMYLQSYRNSKKSQ